MPIVRASDSKWFSIQFNRNAVQRERPNGEVTTYLFHPDYMMDPSNTWYAQDSDGQWLEFKPCTCQKCFAED